MCCCNLAYKVDACRAKCCANPHCVSITLGPSEEEDVGGGRGYDCWLNAVGGAAPYHRDVALMAFVKRSNNTVVGVAVGADPENDCNFNYPNRDPQ